MAKNVCTYTYNIFSKKKVQEFYTLLVQFSRLQMQGDVCLAFRLRGVPH
jgi:hypothetical protein